MTSMSPDIRIAKDIHPNEVLDMVLSDERWKLAEAEYGLKSVNVRVNPLNPSKGRIYTRWTDPQGPMEFMMRVIKAFDFYRDGEAVVVAEEAPQIEVSPERMKSAVTPLDMAMKAGAAAKPSSKRKG